METNIIRDPRFQRTAYSVKPDAKKRVVLPGPVKDGVTYHVYENTLGQIVLDPQVTIPASEAWLFQNPEALASVRKGLKDIAEGRVTKINLKDL
jgi:hypothetical protein